MDITSQKPLVTVSGKKKLFKSELSNKITGDLPQESIEWRRPLAKNSKTVYIDVEFVDFDVDNVERERDRLSRLSITEQRDETGAVTSVESKQVVSQAFFNPKLLGQPILHTFWTDSSDLELDSFKAQFDEWIGQVQGSSCTEWAVIVVESSDTRQVSTSMLKSKLQSTHSQHSIHGNDSLLGRIKTGFSTMFQSDSNSDRWLHLIEQAATSKPDDKAQQSYLNFVKKLKSLILASFSKQIELFEEQLRIQREMRTDKDWDFYKYFIVQEELAFAFEFLTLLDDALVQYDLLDALFSDLISTADLNDTAWMKPLATFSKWQGLCLDSSSSYVKELRQKIVDRRSSLLELRNYLFSRQCDLMLLQNQPWKVAASTLPFLHNCIREHRMLEIETFPGALTCWVFTSVLEVLQKCECYSCTSQMENYSLHTVDIWNYARRKLEELGTICNLMPNMQFDCQNLHHVVELIGGMGTDPYNGKCVSNQTTDVSPQSRLKNALASQAQFLDELISISELTVGTYKHIGRKRHALLVGKDLAELYIKIGRVVQAQPFLTELEKILLDERWKALLMDARKGLLRCYTLLDNTEKLQEYKTLLHDG